MRKEIMKKENIKKQSKLVMKNTVNFLDEKIAPKMAGLASQKHLMAVRNGIVATIPFIIVGSLFLILLNLPLDGAADSKNLGMLMPPQLKEFFLAVFYLSMGSMGLYAAFGIAFELGKAYKFNTLLSGMLGVFAYLLWFDYGTGVGTSFSGATVFTAMVAAIIAVEIQHLCIRFRLTIRMPKVVPKAISDSFLVITPIFFTAIIFGSFRYLLNFDLNNFLAIAMNPMQDILTGGLIGVILLVVFITFFWSFGIHGTNVIGSVVRPFWQIAIDENSAWAALGKNGDLPHAYPEQFLQWFIWIGGAGATLGLIIASLIFAKSKQAKAISRSSLVPGIFNINEPVIFGFPIILNGTLMIPFILAPLALVFSSILLIQIFGGIAFVALTPWTLPGPIGALFSTGLNPWAFVVVLINLVVVTLIYSPFVIKWDRKLVQDEQQEMTIMKTKDESLKNKKLVNHDHQKSNVEKANPTKQKKDVAKTPNFQKKTIRDTESKKVNIQKPNPTKTGDENKTEIEGTTK